MPCLAAAELLVSSGDLEAGTFKKLGRGGIHPSFNIPEISTLNEGHCKTEG